ncbi:hypothetical protein LCGC14_2536300 [marine sediment metagenome]|uniref:Uncharacterized protein n=1 Tax=marine sediment metagenome TaxID=412755 RepID=A0A0F9D3L5_9ZZZZ
MSKKDKFYEDTGFWAGVGAYYGLSWIFNFYPAFVMGWAGGLKMEGASDNPLAGLIIMIVSYIVLWFLILNRQFFIVLMIYIIFAFPFISMLIQYFNYVEEHSMPF